MHEWSTAGFTEQKSLLLALVCLQFGRLERVEVGGTKGKALTNAIKQVHADFLVAHGKFQEVSYESGLKCCLSCDMAMTLTPSSESASLRYTPGLMRTLPAVELAGLVPTVSVTDAQLPLLSCLPAGDL